MPECPAVEAQSLSGMTERASIVTKGSTVTSEGLRLTTERLSVTSKGPTLPAKAFGGTPESLSAITKRRRATPHAPSASRVIPASRKNSTHPHGQDARATWHGHPAHVREKSDRIGTLVLKSHARLRLCDDGRSFLTFPRRRAMPPPMSNGLSVRAQPMVSLALVLSAGFGLLALSSCARQEADSGKPAALPVVSSAAKSNAVASPAGHLPPTAGAALPVAAASSTTGNMPDAVVGQPSELARTTVQSAPQPVLTGASQPETLPIPLAAVGYNPALKLNPRQVAQMVQMGQTFLAATAAAPSAAPSPASVDTASAAPADAVSQAWIDAQQASDERFRVMFGYAAFNAQQILRYQQEHPAPQAVR